jgi:hypothetical protein
MTPAELDSKKGIAFFGYADIAPVASADRERGDGGADLETPANSLFAARRNGAWGPKLGGVLRNKNWGN